MLPEIPYNNWKPRPNQMGLWSYLQGGGLRAVEVAHRRWGKDDIALHRTAVASTRRVGNYWHMLPQFNQCRKAIWEAVNPRTGMKRIDEAFPMEMRSSTRSTDMYIGFKNGIEAVRNALGSCWFDEVKCSIGISALEGYRAEYDEEKKVLRNTPLHDHNSHGADGFRTFAVGYRPKRINKPYRRQAISGWAV